MPYFTNIFRLGANLFSTNIFGKPLLIFLVLPVKYIDAFYCVYPLHIYPYFIPFTFSIFTPDFAAIFLYLIRSILYPFVMLIYILYSFALLYILYPIFFTYCAIIFLLCHALFYPLFKYFYRLSCLFYRSSQ